jgi:hypothetical protein
MDPQQDTPVFGELAVHVGKARVHPQPVGMSRQRDQGGAQDVASVRDDHLGRATEYSFGLSELELQLFGGKIHDGHPVAGHQAQTLVAAEAQQLRGLALRDTVFPKQPHDRRLADLRTEGLLIEVLAERIVGQLQFDTQRLCHGGTHRIAFPRLGVVGIPGAIAFYLVWWATQSLGARLDRIIQLLDQIARAVKVPCGRRGR